VSMDDQHNPEQRDPDERGPEHGRYRLPDSEVAALALSRQLVDDLPRTVHLVGSGVNVELILNADDPLLMTYHSDEESAHAAIIAGNLTYTRVRAYANEDRYVTVRAARVAPTGTEATPTERDLLSTFVSRVWWSAALDVVRARMKAAKTARMIGMMWGEHTPQLRVLEEQLRQLSQGAATADTDSPAEPYPATETTGGGNDEQTTTASAIETTHGRTVLDDVLERRRHEHPDIDVLIQMRQRWADRLRQLLGDQEIPADVTAQVMSQLGIEDFPAARRAYAEQVVDDVCGLGEVAAARAAQVQTAEAAALAWVHAVTGGPPSNSLVRELHERAVGLKARLQYGLPAAVLIRAATEAVEHQARGHAD